MHALKCKNVQQLRSIARKLIKNFPHQRIFAFYGKMGSGKTTFIKEICKELGVTDTVTSPTFAIINEYNTEHGERVFHFDLYRVNRSEELMDLGYEDYFYSGSYCFIEWPERFQELLPENYVYVSIEVDEESDARIFKFRNFNDH